MSDQRKPKASPMRSPVVRERRYNASNRSPRAACSNVRACSASSGVISSCRIFGGSTLEAGLKGMRLNLTACSNARCNTREKDEVMIPVDRAAYQGILATPDIVDADI